jgi:hypothetical protein
MAEQKQAAPKAPVRDQVMPAYAYPPANSGGTLTVRTDSKHKTSVQVNGQTAY